MLKLDAVTVAWQDGTSVEIRCPSRLSSAGAVRLGHFDDAEVSGVPSAANEADLLSYADDTDGIFGPIRLLQETPYEVVVGLPFDNVEAEAYRAKSVSRAWPFANPAIADFVQVLSPRLWKEVRGCLLIGAVFNAKGYAGVVDLSILEGRFRCSVEVLTAKLEYEREYKLLLAEVAERHIQLIYEVGSAAGIRLSDWQWDEPDLGTALFHLRRLMMSHELPVAVETVLSSPLDSLASNEETRQSSSSVIPDAAYFSRRASQMSFSPGGPLRSLFGGYTPRSLPVRVKRQIFDNPENRFVKAFIEGLSELLIKVHEACLLDGKRVQASETERWIETVYEWLSNDLWRDVGLLTSIPQNSQRLQKSSGYRDILFADSQLRDALAIPLHEGALQQDAVGDVKPVSTLYEYWCYFIVRDILRELFGPDQTAAGACQ